jgi:hypothetical protein
MGIQTHSTELVHVVKCASIEQPLPLLSGTLIAGHQDDRRSLSCGSIERLQALLRTGIEYCPFGCRGDLCIGFRRACNDQCHSQSQSAHRLKTLVFHRSLSLGKSSDRVPHCCGAIGNFAHELITPSSTLHCWFKQQLTVQVHLPSNTVFCSLGRDITASIPPSGLANPWRVCAQMAARLGGKGFTFDVAEIVFDGVHDWRK